MALYGLANIGFDVLYKYAPPGVIQAGIQVQFSVQVWVYPSTFGRMVPLM